MWVAAIDFKKAFDSIHHDKLWHTLEEQQVPTAYINLLQTLYTQQCATVKTDQHSRPFNIERGVKQGDPLSALLFNALLEHLFKRLKFHWTADRFGIQLGYSTTTRLTNLRFADDVLLIGRTKAAITRMLTDLYDLAHDYGLELHPEKTVVLFNDSKRSSHTARTPVDIRGNAVQVLPFAGSTKYLGRLFTFHDYHQTEIHNRMACAWRKFHLLRSELTNKHYPLKARLRLFNGTITPTVLYACTSWTLTDDLATTLHRTQRRMLRLIVGTPRRTSQPSHPNDDSNHNHSPNGTTHNNNGLEPWCDFIQRATHVADAIMSKHNITSWTITYIHRKWKWAQRLAGLPDNRWCRLVTRWTPNTTEQRPAYRKQGRPRKRWNDDITNFITQLEATHTTSTSWLDIADKEFWRNNQERFVSTTSGNHYTANTDFK